VSAGELGVLCNAPQGVKGGSSSRYRQHRLEEHVLVPVADSLRKILPLCVIPVFSGASFTHSADTSGMVTGKKQLL